MALFNKNSCKGGIKDEIRCDEQSYLIWKWRPIGAKLGETFRENAIRNGSSLRVKDGEVAVFVYKQKNGMMQDFIVGPFDEKIHTKNLPVLSKIIGLSFEGGTPFPAEIYFINLAKIIQIRFAVPFFDVCDPRFPDFSVPIAARGTVSFQISDYEEFIKLHRLTNFDLEDFQKQIRDAISRYVKNVIANAPTVHAIPVAQIGSKSAQINADIERELAQRLKKDFGIIVSGVDINAIEIDKTSEGYLSLMSVTKDITQATVQARTAADIENYAENLRVQREETQYAMHKATQTANADVFFAEQQAKIGVAAANAFGQMSANGGGTGDIGFNPAAMMASMVIGKAVGQNIADMMNGSGNPTQTKGGISYLVALNGQPQGPFGSTELYQMALAGTLTINTLVWKEGMTVWQPAGAVQELQFLFTIPPIPTGNP